MRMLIGLLVLLKLKRKNQKLTIKGIEGTLRQELGMNNLAVKMKPLSLEMFQDTRERIDRKIGRNEIEGITDFAIEVQVERENGIHTEENIDKVPKPGDTSYYKYMVTLNKNK